MGEISQLVEGQNTHAREDRDQAQINEHENEQADRDHQRLASRAIVYRSTTASGFDRSMRTSHRTRSRGIVCFSAAIRTVIVRHVARAASNSSCGPNPSPRPPLSRGTSATAVSLPFVNAV